MTKQEYYEVKEQEQAEQGTAMILIVIFCPVLFYVFNIVLGEGTVFSTITSMIVGGLAATFVAEKMNPKA